MYKVGHIILTFGALAALEFVIRSRGKKEEV